MDFRKYLIALGKALRCHRERIDRSQEEIAAKAGLHRNYLGGVERGEHNISLRSLLHVAEALGVELPDLLHEVHEARRSVERKKV